MLREAPHVGVIVRLALELDRCRAIWAVSVHTVEKAHHSVSRSSGAIQSAKAFPQPINFRAKEIRILSGKKRRQPSFALPRSPEFILGLLQLNLGQVVDFVEGTDGGADEPLNAVSPAAEPEGGTVCVSGGDEPLGADPSPMPATEGYAGKGMRAVFCRPSKNQAHGSAARSPLLVIEGGHSALANSP